MFFAIIRWILFSILDRLFFVIALLTNPLVSLFVTKNGELPRLFLWWATPDSNMFGYDGDSGFYEENKDKINSYFGRWWVCTKWLYRNTAQGFSTYVCGLDDSKFLIKEEVYVDETGLTKEERLAYNGGKIVGFEYKGGFLWWFTDEYYFRYRIGYKFNFAESRGYDLPAQIVQSITPFKKIE